MTVKVLKDRMQTVPGFPVPRFPPGSLFQIHGFPSHNRASAGHPSSSFPRFSPFSRVYFVFLAQPAREAVKSRKEVELVGPSELEEIPGFLDSSAWQDELLESALADGVEIFLSVLLDRENSPLGKYSVSRLVRENRKCSCG